MDDPIQVRFPCPEHGIWFRHMDALRSYDGRSVWCEGGETRRLRLWSGHESDLETDDVANVWVEVTDD